MTRLFNKLILLCLLAIPGYSQALESLPGNDEEYLCYSQSMIGYDSVINSRLGVPAERALDLAVLTHSPGMAARKTYYSKALLKTILDAYLWQGSPHGYAIKVFYRCAQDDTRLRSAQNDWLATE
jgi:hypothetical protein